MARPDSKRIKSKQGRKEHKQFRRNRQRRRDTEALYA